MSYLQICSKFLIFICIIFLIGIWTTYLFIIRSSKMTNFVRFCIVLSISELMGALFHLPIFSDLSYFVNTGVLLDQL